MRKVSTFCLNKKHLILYPLIYGKAGYSSLDMDIRKYARQTKNYTFRNIVKEENHNFRIYLHLLSVISLTAHVLLGRLVVYRLSKCVYVAQAAEER